MYHPRIADTHLQERVQSSAMVLIEGPRGVGKTELARQFAKSEVLLGSDESARHAIEIDPTLILDGPAPRLIDEWQHASAIWNPVRRLADQRGGPGQFILTSSALPAEESPRTNGRISRLRLRPMTLRESGHSSGKISLRGLMAGEVTGGSNPGPDLKELVERLCIGGWPGHRDLSLAAALTAQREYLSEIRQQDIVHLDGVRREPDLVARVIGSLARNTSTPVSGRMLASDAGGADGRLDDGTVRDYLSAFHRLMILEEQRAWSPPLRSKSILRKAPRRHLVDPSLAVAALEANPDALLADLRWLGRLFESMVYRDLASYADSLEASLYHYLDNTGLEIDAIVQDKNGRWSAFQVRLGAGQVEQAAATLQRFKDRIDTTRSGEPQTLGVIVSSGYVYRRNDGIVVFPVTALGP